MLISQAASSLELIGFPRFGACAKAALEPRASVSTTANKQSLSVYILHLAAALDRPTCNGVVVLAREAGHGRNARGLAAHSHDLGSSRLCVARLVRRSALQDCGTAVPAPRNAEPGERFAQHRLLQSR